MEVRDSSRCRLLPIFPTMPPTMCRRRSSLRLLLAAAPVLATALAAGCSSTPLPTTPVAVGRVELTPAVDTLKVGAARQFAAAVFDTAGNPVAAGVAWRSGNPQIFTVTSLGRVQGVGEGTARLIATSGSVSDTSWVTVLPVGDWIVQTSTTNSELNGVFFLPDGRAGWAVGALGTIVRTTDAGVTWARQTSNTNVALHGVWFTSATDGWAVGAAGTVVRTTNGGATWTRLNNVGQGVALMDVCFATPDTGWVVGQSGLALRTRDAGATWEAFYAPTAQTLESVSFAGTRDGWAVGGAGVIAGTHDRGATWFLVPGITIQPLKAVWTRSPAVARGVGAQGVVVRTVTTPDSAQWELRNAGGSRQLEGVHFPSDAIGYAVGADAGVGAILRTDDGGLTWEAQTSRSANRLNDVFFVDVLRGWAVGQGGTIVHTARGGKP